MSIVYTNKDSPLIFNESITEWDIKSANTSLMRYFDLAPIKVIQKFENMEKDKRERAVGMYGRKHPEFIQALEKAFTDIIQEFMKANSLDENDIVSIKKDAVFVRNKRVKQSSFRDSVNFITKGVYNGCLILPKYEFYLSLDDSLDVKGINDSKLSLHSDGVLLFVKTIIKIANKWTKLQEFFKEYAIAYKMKELPFNAYREFTTDSIFRVNMMGNILTMDTINEELLKYTDISYNYINIFLEALRATRR